MKKKPTKEDEEQLEALMEISDDMDCEASQFIEEQWHRHNEGQWDYMTRRQWAWFTQLVARWL